MKCFYPVFYLLFFLLSACREHEVLPPSVGKEGEVLVECPSSLSHTPLVSSLLEILSSDYPSLPQKEPWFDITRIDHLRHADVLKRHRTVLSIDTTDKETILTIKRDVYARDQVILKLKLHIAELNDSIRGQQLGTTVAHFFEKELLNAQVARLKRNPNRKIQEAIRQKFNIQIFLPEDYFIARSVDGFIWLRRESAHTSTGLFICSLPYTGLPAEALRLRDSITALHIPGPSQGSFMMTNHEVPVLVEHDSLMNHKAWITSGLWKMKNDFMGGPFINACIRDDRHNRLLMVDGYVYAPRFDKREYIRRIKAIIYTLSSL
jgi:hypothetical protein